MCLRAIFEDEDILRMRDLQNGIQIYGAAVEMDGDDAAGSIRYRCSDRHRVQTEAGEFDIPTNTGFAPVISIAAIVATAV